jgi:1,4-alpha-glucan branching enzyme
VPPPRAVNYWGHQPVSFFAPHPAYSSRRDALGPVDEFRDLVKALHRAGIEIILDVVFNHTAEGGEDGSTLSSRGIDSPTYYILGDGGARYADYTGCGNTLSGNHPVVRRMIVDSLRYWVEVMHVDGFRFDLASILARDAAADHPPQDISPAGQVAGTGTRGRTAGVVRNHAPHRRHVAGSRSARLVSGWCSSRPPPHAGQSASVTPASSDTLGTAATIEICSHRGF